MAKFAQSDGRRIRVSVKILPKFFGQKTVAGIFGITANCRFEIEQIRHQAFMRYGVFKAVNIDKARKLGTKSRSIAARLRQGLNSGIGRHPEERII
jgi:hypothetical protein